LPGQRKKELTGEAAQMSRRFLAVKFPDSLASGPVYVEPRHIIGNPSSVCAPGCCCCCCCCCCGESRTSDLHTWLCLATL